MAEYRIDNVTVTDTSREVAFWFPHVGTVYVRTYAWYEDHPYPWDIVTFGRRAANLGEVISFLQKISDNWNDAEDAEGSGYGSPGYSEACGVWN